MTLAMVVLAAVRVYEYQVGTMTQSLKTTAVTGDKEGNGIFFWTRAGTRLSLSLISLVTLRSPLFSNLS